MALGVWLGRVLAAADARLAAPDGPELLERGVVALETLAQALVRANELQALALGVAPHQVEAAAQTAEAFEAATGQAPVEIEPDHRLAEAMTLLAEQLQLTLGREPSPEEVVAEYTRLQEA